MSDTLTAPDVLTTLGAVNCCGDCPITNPFPPNESDCPYFVTTGGSPDCIQNEQREQTTPSYLGQICISEVAVTIRNARDADLV